MFELDQWIRLYILPTGRRIWAHRKVRDEASQRGLAELVAHVERALEHDGALRRREHGLLEIAGRVADPAAMHADLALDRALGSLHDVLSAFASSPVDAPFKAPAAQLLGALFPQGVAAVTLRSFEEEQTAVAHLVARMDGELAPAIAQLGLTPHRESIRAHNAALAAALGVRTVDEVTRDEVRRLDGAGHDLLLETVARVLGLFPSALPDHLAARKALLQPIAEQSADVRRARQRRRQRVTDVDPETGEDEVPAGQG